MKKELGIGIAALAALAAEGKDFSRSRLNVLLDELEASPLPRIQRGAFATCYVTAMPVPEGYEHICRKCGAHTLYRKNRRQMANKVARRRDEAARLKALGLDIALDETPLCARCRSAADLGIPVSGTVVAVPERADFPFAVGDKVRITEKGQGWLRVVPLVRECWVAAKYISASGELLGDDVRIRQAPRAGSFVTALGFRRQVLKRLPAQPGAPADWVRVEPLPEWKERDTDDWSAGSNAVRVFAEHIAPSYEEGDSPTPRRLDALAWVINGTRTVIRENDAQILEAFLTGKKVWRADFDEKRALKKQILRLRELLGAADAP